MYDEHIPKMQKNKRNNLTDGMAMVLGMAVDDIYSTIIPQHLWWVRPVLS
jgi:hypothetical protein